MTIARPVQLSMSVGHEVDLAVDARMPRPQSGARLDDRTVDIGLPGFDGLEVARCIRASVDGIGEPPIALSGY